MNTELNKSEQGITSPSPLGVSGLGGWLIVIQISLYLTLIASSISVFGHLILIIVEQSGQQLIIQDPLLSEPAWKPVIWFERIYSPVMLVFTIFVLVQFYRKKAAVPKLMIAFYLLNALIAIILFVLTQQAMVTLELTSDRPLITRSVREILTCLIFIPYLLKSERVKNTFIR